MTFEDFHQLCNQAVSSGQAVTAPCPIVIGDGDVYAGIGDTKDHYLVIFKTAPDDASLRDIYQKVRFSFAAMNNTVAITPLTTGT